MRPCWLAPGAIVFVSVMHVRPFVPMVRLLLSVNATAASFMVMIVVMVMIMIMVMVVVMIMVMVASVAGGCSGWVGGCPCCFLFAGGGVLRHGLLSLLVRVGVPVQVWVGVGVRLGRGVGVEALLHLQQVQVGHVVVPQLLVIQAHHLHLSQTQAQQKVLEASEVQPVSLAVAVEQLLDVEVLLALRSARRLAGAPCLHVGRLGDLQVVVVVLVLVLVLMLVLVLVVVLVRVGVAMIVGMGTVMVVVPIAVAVAALLEQDRDHTQEAEPGVHVDLHGVLNASIHHIRG